ncbi:hypothetical protein [Haloarcula sp. 1CSR25-25]|uniref:hypothetical protein n=1 Tax=Haloarcula sp. 1CSR25-25 TaxID=2862545 RepID=UPI002894F09E|nr:hypothetical protein [Haloarcula sp. 1CSR25-25]MDT3434688.1 hypothetical protein [Haloarcula sp. 1CSR25-25]
MTTSLDWYPWYEEVLEELSATIADADVEWATDGNRTPWIILGQKRPSGIDHPHAMVLSFSHQRDDVESSRRNELIRISTDIGVMVKQDPQTPQENLLTTLEAMAAVETALYDDRSLKGTVDYLVIQQADAFELESNIGRELVGNIQIELTKQADQPRP